MSSAHTLAASAADEIARAGDVTDTVSISGKQPQQSDVVGGMVDLRIARYQQAANLAVFKTADGMSREVLEMM